MLSVIFDSCHVRTYEAWLVGAVPIFSAWFPEIGCKLINKNAHIY